jgi:hypothetical protein
MRFLKAELLIALATCSSEAVLPQLVRKLEIMGVGRPVVGIVIAAGFSFNLDGGRHGPELAAAAGDRRGHVLGNAVATIVIGKWEDDFDHERARRVLSDRHQEFDDVELDDVPPHHHSAPAPATAGADSAGPAAPQPVVACTHPAAVTTPASPVRRWPPA